jgi:hypothetical protein
MIFLSHPLLAGTAIAFPWSSGFQSEKFRHGMIPRKTNQFPSPVIPCKVNSGATGFLQILEKCIHYISLYNLPSNILDPHHPNSNEIDWASLSLR